MGKARELRYRRPMTYLVPNSRRPEALNPLEEAFCIDYVMRGCTGLTKALAAAMYHLDPELEKKQGLPSHATLQQRAYWIIKDPRIVDRIDGMRAEAAKDARYRLMDHITRLEHLSLLAEAQGEIKVALAAEIARGKAAGYQRDNAPMLYSADGSPAAPPPVDPTTGQATTNIHQAVFIQSMSPRDAMNAYQRLMDGQAIPEINPRIVTTIPRGNGLAAEQLVIE